jgi:CheY-like chemotaxis protein
MVAGGFFMRKPTLPHNWQLCHNIGSRPDPARDFAMAKVLIVDDMPDFCDSLAKVLQKSGHEVTSVTNGREALATALASTPDVVVLDLLMPEMDGPSFLEVVRSYLRLQSLPVVVVTGLAESPLVDRVRSLKVNSILVKGKASPEEMQHAVEEALVHLPA